MSRSELLLLSSPLLLKPRALATSGTLRAPLPSTLSHLSLSDSLLFAPTTTAAAEAEAAAVDADVVAVAAISVISAGPLPLCLLPLRASL